MKDPAKHDGTPRGGRRVTMAEVAAAAGVHTGTVSRVLSPQTRGLVNPKTAERIEAAVERLGYQPDPVARSLRTKRTMTIGVVVNDLTNPLFPPIVVGIEDRLSEAGYTSLLANSKGDHDRAWLAFDALRARQVDAFILTTVLRDEPRVEAALAEDVPIVLAVRTVDGGKLPAVVFDEASGMRQAVAHLAELGHRKIAHIAGPLATSNAFRRREGFVEAMTERGLDPADHRIVVADAFTLQAGEKAFATLLDSCDDCTAVIAGNDLIAIGGYTVFAERGLSCPGDISVIGINDMPLADRLSPPLTTLRVPQYELGVRTAELLLERLADPETKPLEIAVPETLVVRGSTGPLRG